MRTIHARLNHPFAANKDLYCFDAPEYGLIAEPFVDSATLAIHLPLRWHHGFDHFSSGPNDNDYRKSEAVQLRFTSDENEGRLLTNEDQPVIVMDLLRPQGDGYLYAWSMAYPPEAVENSAWEMPAYYEPAWLCPVLLTYFPDGPPESIWVQIRETVPPSPSEGDVAEVPLL